MSAVLGHAPDVVLRDGAMWKIVCACAWECWDLDEDNAWDAFEDHVLDDVRGQIALLRNLAIVSVGA